MDATQGSMVVDWLESVPGDGGVWRRAAAMVEPGRERKLAAIRKKGGARGGERGGAGGRPRWSLTTREARQGGMGTASWRQCRAALWRQCGEEGGFAKTPWNHLKIIANRSSSNFSDLNEAPNHFYKNWKNSFNLPSTGRSSTKICAPR